MEKETIPGIHNQQAQLILNLFLSTSTVRELILFGSRAKGNYREGSDIDLAIKGEKISHQERSQWLSQYEDLYLPWKLDLVIYDGITEPALKEHIDRVGKSLFRR